MTLGLMLWNSQSSGGSSPIDEVAPGAPRRDPPPKLTPDALEAAEDDARGNVPIRQGEQDRQGEGDTGERWDGANGRGLDQGAVGAGPGGFVPPKESTLHRGGEPGQGVLPGQEPSVVSGGWRGETDFPFFHVELLMVVLFIFWVLPGMIVRSRVWQSRPLF